MSTEILSIYSCNSCPITEIKIYMNKREKNKENSIFTSANNDKNNKILKNFGITSICAIATIATGFLAHKGLKNNLKLNLGARVKSKKNTSQIGYLFRDSATKKCDVSLKKGEHINSLLSYHIDSLPSRYVEILSNGKNEIKECVVVDNFEIFDKGNGLGSKKLQEIIQYAKDKHGGRLYLQAGKIGDNQSPLLFYYKNGLRSIDESTNRLLSKVLQGELPRSAVPCSTIMYLP